jgi:hypothetical protein
VKKRGWRREVGGERLEERGWRREVGGVGERAGNNRVVREVNHWDWSVWGINITTNGATPQNWTLEYEKERVEERVEEREGRKEGLKEESISLGQWNGITKKMEPTHKTGLF